MRSLFCALAIMLFAGAVCADETNSNPPIEQAELHAAIPPQTTVKNRTTLGVALEGGGALGLAHVGVLQWFEEHHIPVDYVAGTSMGGLVGGLYASGVSPADLRKLIAGVHWNDILSGSTPFEDLSFRRKEDQRAYPTSLIFGLRDGISLPGGLNAGHQISLLIDRETLPYYHLKSFNDLPIPFRCVATELVTGQQVVFRQGSLAEALRATISIPGAFTPVYDGKKVYVDGGLVNNLPTNVVREMGADVIIAVHLDTQPVQAKDVQSLFGVLQQSVRVVVAESEVRGMAAADAVVSVALGNYSSTDYSQNAEIMQKGYDAAAAKSALLSKFALGDEEWREYVAQRQARTLTDKPTPQFITVQGTDGDRAADIERFLKPLVGQPLDSDTLDRSLTRLTGVGRYDTVGYRIAEQGGKQGLLIVVTEKNYAPPTLQPAIAIDGSQPSDVTFTLASRLTLLDVVGFRSEWRTDFLFGNTYGGSSELYRPFSAVSRWFFAPRVSASNTGVKFFNRNDLVADYRLERASVAADFGYGFSRFSEIRAGYEEGYLRARLRLGHPEFYPVDGRVGNFRLHYLMDRTDDPVVPRKGLRIESTFRWFDASPQAKGAFPTLTTDVEYFRPVSPLGSVFAIGNGGTTLGYNQTGFPQFFLGGVGSLAAYGSNELLGNQYYYFRTGYLHDLLTLPPFVGTKVYAIGSFEFGKMYGASNESGFPSDVTAGILAETALGPLFIGGSAGDSGHRKWFFQLGRVF